MVSEDVCHLFHGLFNIIGLTFRVPIKLYRYKVVVVWNLLLTIMLFFSLGYAQERSYRNFRSGKEKPFSRQNKGADISQQLYEQSWAIIIGIDIYKNADILPLSYAVNDAREVKAALENLGFPHQNIFTLEGEQATKQAIEKLFRERLRRIKPDDRSRVGPNDRLLVFFAAHGEPQSRPHGGEENFLLPYDADRSNLFDTAIALEDLRRVGEWSTAKHVLFVVDACYSGFPTNRGKAPQEISAVQLARMAGTHAVEILSAARSIEKAKEVNGHGIFTAWFLEGLRGPADENTDGIITLSEIDTFVANRVAKETNGEQNPRRGKLAGEGEFLFLLPGARIVPLPPVGTTGQSQMAEGRRASSFLVESQVPPSPTQQSNRPGNASPSAETTQQRQMAEASVREPPPSPPPPRTPTTLQINQTTHAARPMEVTITIETIDFLPNGRMRWNMLFSNPSFKEYSISLVYSKTYLTDAQGNEYKVQADSQGNQANRGLTFPLPGQANRKYWIEFPAPQNGAKDFTVVLAGNTFSSKRAHFRTFRVALP